MWKPNVQFIHVVRDGRDVSLSIRSDRSGATNACEMADDWNRTLESIQAFSRDLPRDQYFEVRYEDLTGQTSYALGALGDFLGQLLQAEGLCSRTARNLRARADRADEYGRDNPDVMLNARLIACSMWTP